MSTITIRKKMSGTGTIHDLASDQYDRVIDFGNEGQYAIVLAAYYSDHWYIAASAEEAVEIHEREKAWSHGIFDHDGNILRLEDLYNRAGLY